MTVLLANFHTENINGLQRKGLLDAVHFKAGTKWYCLQQKLGDGLKGHRKDMAYACGLALARSGNGSVLVKSGKIPKL